MFVAKQLPGAGTVQQCTRCPYLSTNLGESFIAAGPRVVGGAPVAHSGGADSTCLLYLLHSWLSQQTGQEGPIEVLSLSVDHGLQPGSSTTAELCRQFCQTLHVPSQILRIPWSRPPFPDRPEIGGPIETVARLARYRVLFEAMEVSDISAIAMGHHADDNVETLLMRLARSQNTAMPTGIRRCRRWGMGGSPKSLDWAGSSGMHRWIVRPLLSVPKERILATCDFHRLNYTDDPTNFQPSLTPRNFMRHYLSQQPQDHLGRNCHINKVKLAINRLDTIATTSREVSSETPFPTRLHTAAKYITKVQDCIDEEVTRYLEMFAKPSPPSTIFLLPHLTGSIPEEDVQRAIVLRILRFVSPKPWGAPDSEAFRRSSSLRLISTRLWTTNLKPKRPFAAGSEVLWTPMFLDSDGCLRLSDNGHTPREMQGWLASRQPPIMRTGVPSPCLQDISENLNHHHSEGELLWDNRFLVTFDPRLLPAEVLDSCRYPGSVMIVPHGRWLLPKIMWLRAKQKGVVLGGLDMTVRNGLSQLSDSVWVKFRWIRSLESI